MIFSCAGVEFSCRIQSSQGEKMLLFDIEETCAHQSSSLSCSTNYYWCSRTTYPIRLNSLFLASSFPTGNPLVSLGILANNLNLLVLSSWIYDWILQVFLVPLWMFASMKAKLLKLCSLHSSPFLWYFLCCVGITAPQVLFRPRKSYVFSSELTASFVL